MQENLFCSGPWPDVVSAAREEHARMSVDSLAHLHPSQDDLVGWDAKRTDALIQGGNVHRFFGLA
jgi:hypothetical protein